MSQRRQKHDPTAYWRAKSETLNFEEREIREEYHKVSETYARQLERLSRKAQRLVLRRKQLARDVESAIAGREFWQWRTAERRRHHNRLHYPSSPDVAPQAYVDKHGYCDHPDMGCDEADMRAAPQ